MLMSNAAAQTRTKLVSISWLNRPFGRCLAQVTIVLPDCLVPQPAGIALVKASLVGSLELFGGGDNCVVLQAGLLGLDEGEGVSAGGSTVMKHHT